MEFKKSQLVEKILHGLDGSKEFELREVHSIKNGCVYLKAMDTEEIDLSIKYSATSGIELEQFFLPMYSQIKPVSKKTKRKPKELELNESSSHEVPESFKISKKTSS